MSASDDDVLYTLDDVAALLKCTRRQVLELTRHRAQVRQKHPLPVFKINAKMLRVRKSDFVAWLEKISKGVGVHHAWTGTAKRPWEPEIDVVKSLLKRLA